MSDFDPDAYLSSQDEPADTSGGFDPDAYLAGDYPSDTPNDTSPPPTSEGPIATGLRRGAATVGGAAGALYGAGIGTEIGAAGGPIGAFAGALGGALVGGVVGSYAEQGGKELLGVDDSEQMAVNEEAHPLASAAGEFGVGMAGMAPVKGLQLGVRAMGAGVQGAFEAGTQIYQGKFDPERIALQAAGGFALPNLNRVGAAVEGAGRRIAGKFVPGRPNVTPNPDADQAKVDVGSQHVESAGGEGNSTVENPPITRNDSSIGNVQSTVTRDGGNSGRWAKKAASAAPEQDMVTQGDADPATLAALAGEDEGVTPEASPLGTPSPGAVAPAPQAPIEPAPQTPVEATPASANAILEAPTEPAKTLANTAQEVVTPRPFDPDQYLAQVDAGFPKPGEPHAVGENEVTPTPQRPEAFAQAAAKVNAATNVNNAKPRLTLGQKLKPETPPTIAVGEPAESKVVGKTNPNPTDAQKEAGNYEKAGERLLGHDAKYETMKGQTRSGVVSNGERWENVSPADYGYFKKTIGADKDHVDFYNLRNGDKHFIVDQRNPDTGKFDEHKVMVNAKDLADARDTYLQGFSDEKGLSRLHDINEISADDLTKWLKRASKKRPYGAKIVPPKLEPKLVTATVTRLREAGQNDIADKLDAMAVGPDKIQAAAKAQAALTNKSGTAKAQEIKNPRVRNAAVVPQIEGTEGVTAKSKAAAAKNASALADARKVYAAHAPKENETPQETIARAQAGVTATRALPNKYPFNMRVKQEPVLWARAAETLGKRPSPQKLNEFLAVEKALRSGDKNAIDEVRQSQRAEADAARSRRTGDKAVESAEGKIVGADQGVNRTEEAMVEHLDEARKVEAEAEPKAITSPEDILPKGTRTLDMDNPAHRAEIAEALNKNNETTPPKWKEAQNVEARQRAERIAAQKAAREAKTNLGTSKAISEKPIEPTAIKAPKTENKAEGSAEELKRLIAEQQADNDEGAPAKKRSGLKDLLGDFVEDEEASLNLRKVGADINKLLKATKWKGEKSEKSVSESSTTQKAPPPSGPKKGVFDWVGKRNEPQTYMPRDLTDPHDIALSEMSDRFNAHDAKQVSHEVQVFKKLGEVYDSATGKRSLFDKIRQSFSGKRTPNTEFDKMMERIALAREEDAIAQRHPNGGWRSLAALSPTDRAFYDEHLKGVFQQNDAVADWIRNNGGDIGPEVTNHVHRIPRMIEGYDPLMQGGRYRDPVGNRKNISGAPRSTSMDRVFAALERNDGTRFVIQPNDKGYLLWNHGKATQIKDAGFKFEAGKQLEIGPNKYTMDDATMREIERNARGPKDANGRAPMMKYYHNAALSAAIGNLQLTEQARHLDFINNLEDDPYFKAHSTTNPNDPRVKSPDRPEDALIKSKLPEMDQYFVSKRLAHVLDDYAKPGLDEDTLNRARAISQAVTKTIFWNPVIHPMNVGAHFFVGRGWDNLKFGSLKRNMSKAMNEVVQPGKIQREILENGGSLMHQATLRPDVTKAVFKRLGTIVKDDPATWDPIAKKFGWGPSTLTKAIYEGSQKITWAANDLFYITQYLEHRERGLSIKGAINATEKDIPNYRVAPEMNPVPFFGKQRWISKLAQDPLVAGFGRYHTGMMNAFGNMIHGMVSPHATPQERFDAVGKLFALAILGFVIKPALDKGYKNLTGNPSAEAIGRGPLAPLEAVKKVYKGSDDPLAPLRGIAMGSPFLQAAEEAYHNRDFGDRPIIEKGDVARALHGHPGAAARAAYQGGMFALRNTVAPVNQFLNEYQKPSGSLGGGLRDQILGIRNPSPKARKYEGTAPKKAEQSAVSRFKQGGHDIGERWIGRTLGF